MTFNIIHSSEDTDRLDKLELSNLSVVFWQPIQNASAVKSINLSHKQIVAWAKENKLPEVWIGEDDVMFTDDVNIYLNNKPEDYDLYFGGVYAATYFDNNLVFWNGMHCYMVSEKFYDKFLECRDDMHIDLVLAHTGGNFKVCNPRIALQRPGWSKQHNVFIDRNLNE